MPRSLFRSFWNEGAALILKYSIHNKKNIDNTLQHTSSKQGCLFSISPKSSSQTPRDLTIMDLPLPLADPQEPHPSTHLGQASLTVDFALSAVGSITPTLGPAHLTVGPPRLPWRPTTVVVPGISRQHNSKAWLTKIQVRFGLPPWDRVAQAFAKQVDQGKIQISVDFRSWWERKYFCDAINRAAPAMLGQNVVEHISSIRQHTQPTPGEMANDPNTMLYSYFCGEYPTPYCAFLCQHSPQAHANLTYS